MGINRTWTLARSSDRLGPIWFPVVGPILEPGEEVTVVEESRLREAEAERDNARAAAEHAREWNAEMAKRAEKVEAELREAREALRDSARHHHDTITPSRLHDPEHLSFDDCPAKTCVRARGVLEEGDKG